MFRTARILTLSLTAATLLLLGAGRVMAQSVIVVNPRVAYYYPPPAVSYYSPPVVYAPAPRVAYYDAPAVYTPAPRVAYYDAPAVYTPAPRVAYYTAPAVSYYTAPAAVTTTRYGLFGVPRARTTYYYPPVYVGP